MFGEKAPIELKVYVYMYRIPVFAGKKKSRALVCIGCDVITVALQIEVTNLK